MSTGPIEKPPLGLRPRWLAEEERLAEVNAAIERYIQADYPVPAAWVAEERELQERLRIRESLKGDRDD